MKVNGAWPSIPAGIVDRDADVWEALLAVADAAGGDWPERARVAAVTLVTLSKGSTPSLGIRLLSDLRDVFGASDAVSSEALVAALCKLPEAPWNDLKGKPLNQTGLAGRLRQYEVRPTSVRIGEWHGTGYKREDLWDAWQRYLPPPKADDDDDALGPPPQEPVTPVTTVTATTLLDSPSCRRCGEPHDGPALCPDCLDDLHARAKERTA